MDIQRAVSATQQGIAVNQTQKQKDALQAPKESGASPRPVEHQASATKVKQGTDAVQAQAEHFQRHSAIYDQPDQRGQQAIEAYQTLTREEKRAEIQSMMGVDTFA